MNWQLLAVVGAIYAFTTWSLMAQTRYGLALCFFGYTIAAAGMLWDIRTGGH